MENEKIRLERLAKLRQDKGFTQKFVANAVRMDEAAYQKYEYGTREPKLSIVIRLAEFYDVSIDFLVGVDDIPNRRK